MGAAQMPEQTVWMPDWQDKSYWLDGLLPPVSASSQPLSSVDVLIVGSGYTGLNAAIETARGGRTTLVLDTEVPGWGCSTRNGGQVSTSVKPSLEKLSAKFGADRAQAIRGEGETALEWIEDRINSEQIDCSFRRAGRFHAAHTPQAYDEIARDAEKMSRDEGVAAHSIPRSEQRSELGTEFYHGGVVFPRHASLDPARYHHGLLKAAVAAGAHVTGNCSVMSIEKTLNGFEVTTPNGVVRARDVIVATNGYTTGITPWLTRRVIPIGSYIIATEP
jgi:glycine/D-amino acid oxidase-like deaminating enzyme